MDDQRHKPERRSSVRIRADVKVQIEFIHPGHTNLPTSVKKDLSTTTGEIWIIDGIMTKVSLTGATVKIPNMSQEKYFRLLHHPEIKNVRMVCEFSKVGVKARFHGTVIWSDYHKHPERACFFGVSFGDMEDRDKRALRDYLNGATRNRRTKTSPLKPSS